MKKSVLHFALCLAILAITFSCKAYRNVENLQPSVSLEVQKGPFVKESLSKLYEGDKIIAYLITGEKYYLYYKQINGKNLVGTLWKKNGEKVQPIQSQEIPIDYIEKVYVYRKSAAATIPVVLIGSFVIVVGLFAIALSSGGGYW